MKIITFPQWIEKHSIEDLDLTVGLLSVNLPPIILNPVFADLYNDEYEGYIGLNRNPLQTNSLSSFLKAITEEGSPHHDDIIRQLSNRGINTKSVGGGGISDDLYDYMNQKKLDNPINEYLFEPLSIRKLDMLYWKGWVFPPSMFVFIDSMDKPLSINWPTRNPMEVKE